MFGKAHFKNKRKTDIIDKNLPATSEYTTTFSRDYIIGRIDFDGKKVSKSQIEKYIHDEAVQLLDTEDYYYGYIYENNVLKYVAHKSNKHETGKVSLLSIVLLNEGKFHLVDHDNFYVFENNNNEIIDRVDYIQAGLDKSDNNLGINLNEMKAGNIPKTLVLKWSLAKKNLYLNSALTGIFAITLAIYFISSQKYTRISAQANEVKQQYLENKNNKQSTPLPNIAEIVKKLAVLTQDQAIITKIISEGTKISINMQFKNEYDAQTFIKNNGGTYENGKVVFSAIYSNTK